MMFGKSEGAQGFLLAVADGFLIFLSVWAAEKVRFWGEPVRILQAESFWKLFVLLSAVQITFYYLGLYDLRNFRARTNVFIFLMESLGISSLALAIIYYTVPPVVIGRGILSLSLVFIFVSTLAGRLTYASICKKLNKEKILIVGTGELARRIARDIYEKGQDAYEIVGFVADPRKKE